MTEYSEYKLNKINSKIKLLKSVRKEVQRKQGAALRKSHKGLFVLADLLLVLAIIFNVGAVFTTNHLMVSQKIEAGDTPEFVERNPVQAKLNNYPTPDYSLLALFVGFVLAMFKQVFLWAVVGCAYVYYRGLVHTVTQASLFVGFVLAFAVLLGFDFFNDFGLFVAML